MRVKDEEGQPAKVIGMVVSAENCLYEVELGLTGLQTDERRSATVDQEVDGLTDDVEARVEAPTTTKRVAATNECELHGHLPIVKLRYLDRGWRRVRECGICEA